MNRLKLYSLIMGIAFVSSFYSCSDLNEPKPGTLSPDTFLENQDDAIALLAGAYSGQYTQKSYQKSWVVVNDIGSDDCGYIRAEMSDRVEFDRFIYSSDFQEFEDMWWHFYMIINRASLVVTEVSKMSDAVFDTPETKKQIIAEARFLRAYNYFNLIRMFGDVPFFGDKYVDDPVGEKTVSREKVDVIYDFIISDLNKAIPDLGHKLKVEKGRATVGAAQTLLSKVYLTRAGWRLDSNSGTMVQGDPKNWQLAADAAKKVMDLGEYHLVDSFQLVFPKDETTGDENGPEHIYFINLTMQAFNETNLYYGPYRGDGNEGGYSSFLGERELYNKFDTADKRIDATYLTYVYALDANGAKKSLVNPTFFDSLYFAYSDVLMPHIGKYLGDESEYKFPPSYAGEGNPSATNNPIFRYAEVLLIYAEAQNEVSALDATAVDAFNQIRSRAGLSLWPNVKNVETGNNFPVTQDGFRQAIRQERRFEFAFEQKRLFDLRRWGILVDVIKARATAPDATSEDVIRAQNINEYKNLFPIPVYELQRNPNLTQNPGL